MTTQTLRKKAKDMFEAMRLGGNQQERSWFWKRNLPADIFTKFEEELWPTVKHYLEMTPLPPSERPLTFQQASRTLQEKGLLDSFGRWYWQEDFGRSPELLSATGLAVTFTGDHEFYGSDKDSPIIPNLGLPTVAEGRSVWGERYLVLPDGSHGPARFRSREEKRLYLRLTGHREIGAYT